MIKIYVAGPYTLGDVAVNVRNAFEVATELAEHDFAPFVPHYTHFWHMLFPKPYEFWLKFDRQFIPDCQGLIRLPGKSNGADKEVEYAESLGIPIFSSVEEVITHFNNGKGTN